MRGASRASFAALTEQLAAENITSATVATRLGDELFAVVGLLDTEHALRRALSDPGKPAAEKGAVAGALLHGKVTQRTEALVVTAVEGHWASPGDMVDAIEELAIERDGARRGRGRRTSTTWRTSCSGSAGWSPRSRTCGPRWPIPSLPADAQAGPARRAARRQGDAVTLRLITQVVLHPRGRPLSRGPGPVRRHRGAAPGAADRGGAFGGRAVREPAQAARRGPCRLLRAPSSPECRD